MVFFKNWNKKYSNLKIKLFNTITDNVGLPPGKPTLRAIRFSLKDVLELLALELLIRKFRIDIGIRRRQHPTSLLYAPLKLNNTYLL